MGQNFVAFAEDSKTPPPPNTRANIPPPVGEQLPIDDYIPYFVVFAIMLGVIFLLNQERIKASNS